MRGEASDKPDTLDQCERSPDKGLLRKKMRERLDALSPDLRKAGSLSILQQLTHILPPNGTCGIFHATAREPDLSELFQTRPDLTLAYPRVIAPGKMVFHACCSLDALQPGKFGILEPDCAFPRVAPGDFDTLICPGIAFSADGSRLGQGGGFYDQYLPQCDEGELLGVCFTLQLVHSLPTESHDIPMDRVITPEEDKAQTTESAP